MPEQEKEALDENFADRYQAMLLERKTLLEHIHNCLGSRSFIELSCDEQISYCHFMKALMENYWQGSILTCQAERFDDSAHDLQMAFEMGYAKTEKGYLTKQLGIPPATEQPPLFAQSDKNFIYGLRLHLGLGCVQNQEQALTFYTAAAEQGHVSAMLNLAYCYETGIGLGKADSKKAFHWFKQAADKNNADAQNRLADYYDEGIGLEESNEEEALILYQLAAVQGHPHAAWHLGVCHENGPAFEPVDENAAFHWFRLAAALGDADGQYCLGLYHQQGKGPLEKSASEALRYFSMAAEQNLAEAQNRLGLFYEKDQESHKADEQAALRWYRLAANQGLVAAQFNLGLCYEEGQGMDQADMKEACHWYWLAAEQGYHGAREQLEALESPFAAYYIALLDSDFTDLSNLILTDKRLETLLFKEDIDKIAHRLSSKAQIAPFLQEIKKRAEQANKNINPVFITALLSLSEEQDKRRSQEQALSIDNLISALVNLINFADAEERQIKDLMHFFCDLQEEALSDDVLPFVITLWHRSQSLGLLMDESGLNRLIAAKIVRHLFGQEYQLQLNAQFEHDDLHTLIFAYERPKPLSADSINSLLSEPLLIKAKQYRFFSSAENSGEDKAKEYEKQPINDL